MIIHWPGEGREARGKCSVKNFMRLCLKTNALNIIWLPLTSQDNDNYTVPTIDMTLDSFSKINVVYKWKINFIKG